MGSLIEELTARAVRPSGVSHGPARDPALNCGFTVVPGETGRVVPEARHIPIF
jgi:hypothetical protein